MPLIVAFGLSGQPVRFEADGRYVDEDLFMMQRYDFLAIIWNDATIVYQVISHMSNVPPPYHKDFSAIRTWHLYRIF